MATNRLKEQHTYITGETFSQNYTQPQAHPGLPPPAGCGI
jgi:hypothetical protein